MKRVLMSLLFAAATLVGGLTATAGPPATTLGWGTVVPAQVPVAEPAATPPKTDSVIASDSVEVPTKAARPRRISPRERRSFGLSIRGINEALNELKRLGELDDELEQLGTLRGRERMKVARALAPQISAKVLVYAQQKHPAAFAQQVQADVKAGRDWTGFFAALQAFVEFIMPFLMMFWGL